MLVMTTATTVFQATATPAAGGAHGLIATVPSSWYAVPGIGEEDISESKSLRRCGEPKAMWRVPGSDPHGWLEPQPAEYERRVVAFLDDALLEQKGSLD